MYLTPNLTSSPIPILAVLLANLSNIMSIQKAMGGPKESRRRKALVSYSNALPSCQIEGAFQKEEPSLECEAGANSPRGDGGPRLAGAGRLQRHRGSAR